MTGLAARAAWAAAALGALAAGEEPPDPPPGVRRERTARRADERARARRDRLVGEGAYERVPFGERCVGMGPSCALCGARLPGPGDPPQRCPSRAGGGRGR